MTLLKLDTERRYAKYMRCTHVNNVLLECTVRSLFIACDLEDPIQSETYKTYKKGTYDKFMSKTLQPAFNAQLIIVVER